MEGGRSDVENQQHPQYSSSDDDSDLGSQGHNPHGHQYGNNPIPNRVNQNAAGATIFNQMVMNAKALPSAVANEFLENEDNLSGIHNPRQGHPMMGQQKDEMQIIE